MCAAGKNESPYFSESRRDGMFEAPVSYGAARVVNFTVPNIPLKRLLQTRQSNLEKTLI